MKKAMFTTLVALGATAFLLMGQDLSKFNGTWKNEKGTQIRKLTVKDGVIYMEEDNNGKTQILRQYPTNGELVMPENYGVWTGAKAKGKMEGGKVIVDTETATFGNWHDEWTMAADGKSFTALRVSTGGNMARGGGKGGPGGGKGPGGGGPPAAGGGPGGPGGAGPGGPGGGKGPGGPGGGKGPGGPAEPETFFKVQ